MASWPKHPVIYEINTRVWLGQVLSLAGILVCRFQGCGLLDRVSSAFER